MANTTGFQIGQPRKPGETAEQREARLVGERRQIEQAREDIRAGRSTSGTELEALLDRFEAGEEFDPPGSSKS
jgi:hypothetical protein